MFTERGDGVAGIKRRHRDLSSDDVRNLATTSGHDQLKEDLESYTWRWQNAKNSSMKAVDDFAQIESLKACMKSLALDLDLEGTGNFDTKRFIEDFMLVQGRDVLL
ncbi:hypothetical protein Tco_0006010 [Tanacetum coccineum]